ncbi:LysR substrate-binding domain-containing protein [Cupriavidus numazuensis]|uniref:LysR substrate-binding domain-containing protein n=1 Tax=Cupriavidus numazuensis TaxID=221992 RepID=A0ABN7PYK2_9BURK|nr:LysR substrate-binding domain-containing protein [Cupriavidus numazuensis]CAG2141113.1 hypothetical protein LMG26411_01988 [Cupriavidus numazuensis]
MALIELLRSGIGWAVVPRRLIQTDLETGTLKELQLQSYPFTEWTIGLDLIWRSDVRPGVIATWLKSEIAKRPVFA